MHTEWEHNGSNLPVLKMQIAKFFFRSCHTDATSLYLSHRWFSVLAHQVWTQCSRPPHTSQDYSLTVMVATRSIFLCLNGQLAAFISTFLYTNFTFLQWFGVLPTDILGDWTANIPTCGWLLPCVTHSFANIYLCCVFQLVGSMAE